jgi:hypothetical protein
MLFAEGHSETRGDNLINTGSVRRAFPCALPILAPALTGRRLFFSFYLGAFMSKPNLLIPSVIGRQAGDSKDFQIHALHVKRHADGELAISLHFTTFQRFDLYGADIEPLLSGFGPNLADWLGRSVRVYLRRAPDAGLRMTAENLGSPLAVAPLESAQVQS